MEYLLPLSFKVLLFSHSFLVMCLCVNAASFSLLWFLWGFALCEVVICSFIGFVMIHFRKRKEKLSEGK